MLHLHLGWLYFSPYLCEIMKNKFGPADVRAADVRKNGAANVWKIGRQIVNYPTRWSLLFIFGFLCWSSSWWWRPHIDWCKLLGPLMRAGMAVLDQFFCKMYFLYVSRSRRKNLGNFFLVLPPWNSSFFGAGPDFRGGGSDFQRGGSTLFSNAPLYGMIRD